MHHTMASLHVLDRGWMGHWTLNGDGIYLLDARSTPPMIDAFNFTSGRIERVASLPRPAIPAEGFVTKSITVSPDNRSILYMQTDAIESEIRLVQSVR